MKGDKQMSHFNTRAAHAADAARDAEAVDWKEAGGHPGGAGREREGGKGVRGLALCGGRTEPPRSLRPPFPPTPPALHAGAARGYDGPPAPGINSLGLQNNRYKLQYRL